MDGRVRRALDDLRAGRVEAAAEALARRVRVAPSDAVAWSNLGIARLRLGQATGAREALVRAVALAPTEVGPWSALAQAALVDGDPAAALDAAREAHRLAPHDPARAWAHGQVAWAAGLPAEAERNLAALVAVQPDHAAAWLTLGAVRAALGRPEEAAAAYTRAAALPAGRVGWRWLAGLRLSRGEVDAASSAAQMAVRTAPDDPDAWFVWGQVLAAGGRCPAEQVALLVAAADRPEVDPQRLDRAFRGVFAEDGVDPEQALTEASVRRWLAHPAFPAWASRTVCAHPVWERYTEALAGWLWRSGGDTPGLPTDALVALAWRAWHTGYLWALPGAGPAGDSLAAQAVRAFAAPPPADAHPGLAALAREVRATAVDEPARAAALPSWTGLVDAVSERVRDQYAEDPYPRWVTVARRPAPTLEAALSAQLGRPVAVPGPRPIEVLVCGCGTGQHALTAAARASDVTVLGVDLSRPSLGRAARRAEALGYPTVRFAVADLLALTGSWAVIEAVGVLHHLADPAAGIAHLARQLQPGGLLLLGLYTARGRSEIPAARALVADLAPTPDGLREARRRILATPPDHPAHLAAWSPDLTSPAGIRDLLFHAHEHFTPPAVLGAWIRAAGLEVLGLVHGQPDARARYAARFPDDAAQTDLDRWSEVEAECPRVFAGMCVLWTRRLVSATGAGATF
jgi:SAM-dependent methyltransferase/tetratricopeptide (TPR) repeat protein